METTKEAGRQSLLTVVGQISSLADIKSMKNTSVTLEDTESRRSRWVSLVGICDALTVTSLAIR